jgi:hypothetical protein
MGTQERHAAFITQPRPPLGPSAQSQALAPPLDFVGLRLESNFA